MSDDKEDVALAPIPSPGLESHPKLNSEVPASVISTRPKSTPVAEDLINNLPPELYARIIGLLGPESGIIFSLTCHQAHDELKRQCGSANSQLWETIWHPEDSLHPSYNQSTKLHNLLQSWIGGGDATKYIFIEARILKFCKSAGAKNSSWRGRFLLKSIYGDEVPGSKHLLGKKLAAWFCWGIINTDLQWICTEEKTLIDEIHNYPSPFNMSGKLWFDTMEVLLAAHSQDPESPFKILVKETIKLALNTCAQDDLKSYTECWWSSQDR